MKLERIALLAALGGALAGCRTTEQVLAEYENNLTIGNYAAAVTEVSELAAKGDDSSLLWQLMAGGAHHLADNRVEAIRHFDEAETRFAKNDQASVFAQGGEGALAMMSNDRAFAYDGGGLDRVFTCLYKSVDFMCDGKLDLARVELNRSSQYQSDWLNARRRDISAAEQRMAKDADAYAKKQQAQAQGDRNQQAANVLGNADFASQIKLGCGYDPASGGNLELLSAKDYMNAYALHVTGIFRWLANDGDRNHLRDAATFAPGTCAARDYAEFEKGGKPKNQVWIWVEDGLCPVREEWRVDLPLFVFPGVERYVKYAGMALPKLRERTWGAANWSVQAGGATTPMAELENVDQLVKTEYDVYMRGALTREITHTVVKVGVQIALGVAADHTNDSNHRLALQLSQWGVAAWAAMTTAADLRCWTTLPKSVRCIRIDRPADGRLDVIADSQRIQLTVPEGNTMMFLRKTAPLAMPVVKQVTFGR